MKPRFVVEFWEHGLLICARPGETGIPFSAMSEVLPLCGRQAVCSIGIPNFFNRTSSQRHVALAICKDGATVRAWEREITDYLAILQVDPRQRWILGVDTGLSSLAIFWALAPDLRHHFEVDHVGNTPGDAADFGRCTRLLAAIPGWRERLAEVAAAYPATKWPAIIARWSELEEAEPAGQSKILNEIET